MPRGCDFRLGVGAQPGPQGGAAFLKADILQEDLKWGFVCSFSLYPSSLCFKKSYLLRVDVHRPPASCVMDLPSEGVKGKQEGNWVSWKPKQRTFLKQFKQTVTNENKTTWSTFRMDY